MTTTDLRGGTVSANPVPAHPDADSEIAEIRADIDARRKIALKRRDKAKHDADRAAADVVKWQRAVHGYERALDALTPPGEEVTERG